MEESRIWMIVGLVAAILVVGCGAGWVVHNSSQIGDDGGGDDGAGDESGKTYWYYLNFGDGDERTKWYSGTGTDAAAGLVSAASSSGMDVAVDDSGQVSSIDGFSRGAGWSVVCYLYSIYDQTAQSGSLLTPTSPGGVFVHSNGWAAFNGYDWSAGNTMAQSCYTVFYMAPHSSDGSVATPVSDDGWMNSGPFDPQNAQASEETQTYWYYLNFGDGDERTKWYSGTGTDAAEGLVSAVSASGMEVEINLSGYIATIDGEGGVYGWSTDYYLYSIYDKAAQDASVENPNDLHEVYFMYSDGWLRFNGYDWPQGMGGSKLAQSASTVFYLGIYDPTDWSVPTAITDDGWKDSGPFAAA